MIARRGFLGACCGIIGASVASVLTGFNEPPPLPQPSRPNKDDCECNECHEQRIIDRAFNDMPSPRLVSVTQVDEEGSEKTHYIPIGLSAVALLNIATDRANKDGLDLRAWRGGEVQERYNNQGFQDTENLPEVYSLREWSLETPGIASMETS